MEQQEEKQSDIVFGVETRAFLKEQLHPVRGVGAFVHGWAFALFPSDQKYLISSLLQGQARLVDPLVRNQVVDHRYDGAFHGTKIGKLGMQNAE